MGTIAETLQSRNNNKNQSFKKLSILIGKDSFFYLLVDENQTITYFKKWVKKDKKVIFSDWVLGKLSQDPHLRHINPTNAQIGICSSQYTLLPVPLFEEPHKRLYLDRSIKPRLSHCYVDSVTTRQYIKVVYSVPPGILKIKKYLGTDCLVKHVMSGLIHYFYHQLGNQEGLCGLVHARGNQLFILLFEDGKLLFTNIYSFYTDEDFFYFISLVLAQLKLKPTNISLYGSGEIYVETKKYHWLSERFIRFNMISNNNEMFGLRSDTSNNAYELLDLISII